MQFDSRLWKLDLEKLWWNKNRIQCRDSLLNHFRSGRGPAHLTGNKGAGKSILTALLSKKLGVEVIKMNGHAKEDMQNDYVTPDILFIDEAQKITQEERQQIRKLNKQVLMTSVSDLSEDGYGLVCRIEPLTPKEVISYVNYQGALDHFDDDALDELFKASKGHMRLINTLCRTALEQPDPIVTKETMTWVAKRKFKLRY